MITVKHATFAYGNEKILTDINLTVAPGTYTLLIGANGSGKSTFVKGILGLKKPQSGDVELFGTSIEKFTEWNRIGYVAQRAAFIDMAIPLSVKETVAMGRAGRVSDAEIIRVLQEVEMEQFLHNDVNKLSGGQQQRVFIARSLLTTPDFLLLDEPTVGLDAHSATQFYELVAALHKKGTAILMVTHDTHFLTEEATDVIELTNGTVSFAGKQSDYRIWHNDHCHRNPETCLVQELSAEMEAE